MKKNDIALLILIISISLGAAYYVGQSFIFNSKKDTVVKVEKTDLIESRVDETDKTVFNKDAINPSVPINIGNSNNQQPFGQ